tara:strand:+ start:459 stop:1271 length:813 start_codon:yes stop_codon:yes gene_type:complete
MITNLLDKISGVSLSIYQKIISIYEEEKSNLKFRGFSAASIDFFDDYPVEAIGKWNQANKDWYNDSKKEIFREFLKPEFEKLICDLTNLISKLDPGIEIESKENIGQLTTQWKGVIPHYWAAVHTSNKDKRTDIQFFVNLCALGIRVGIYTGEYDNDRRVWQSFIRRLSKKKEEVFQVVKELESKDYIFINTKDIHYAQKSDGIAPIINDAQEMYVHVFEQSEFDIIFKIGKEKMTGISLVEEILKCFDDTRELYEILQPNSFNKQRSLI